MHTETSTEGAARRVWPWIAGVLLLACAAVIVAQSFDGDSEGEDGPALRVETLTVEPRSAYQVKRSFVGRVEAARSSDLGFELGGLVDKVWVEEGDSVKRGQRLASLDRQRLKARRNELVAALEQAQAGLELSRSTFTRVSEAAGLDAVSEQENDEARLDMTAREAGVRQLEAQIETVDVELGKSILEAPYTAVVSARYVDEGEVLPAGQAVLRLLESERLEARVGITAEAAGDLEKDQEVVVTVRGQELLTRVKAILPNREARTRTVTVLLAFEDGAAARDGDLAEALLTRPVAAEGFWLPSTALTESVRGLWSCYVVESGDGGSVIARRDLEVLHTETNRVFVRGTLAAGDKVVASGVHRLVPGQRVEPVAGPGGAS